MGRFLARRLSAQPLFRSAVAAAAAKGPFQPARCLSQTSAPRQDEPPRTGQPRRDEPVSATSEPATSEPQRILPNSTPLDMLRDLYGDPSKSAPAARRPAPAARPPLPASLKSNDHLSNQVSMALKSAKVDLGVLKLGINQNRPAAEKKEPEPDPFHLHVYSHKHNTHITFTRPNRNPIVSLSCGNIGFRKSRRGTFDAAYSLTKYALEKVSDAKLKIESLELVLKGFGQGREAAVKVLLGPEGKALRDKIIRVADATKIKFGGTRSEKPRRL